MKIPVILYDIDNNSIQINCVAKNSTFFVRSFQNFSIEVLSKEMDEVQEPEIPERSSYRFAKIWQDGVENEPERGTASLFFSNEKQNLILNLAGNVINLKCVEKFKKNPDGYSYATYETTNGLIMTLGYIGTNGIEWYLKYKNLNGIIMEVELSNDKNAWD